MPKDFNLEDNLNNEVGYMKVNKAVEKIRSVVRIPLYSLHLWSMNTRTVDLMYVEFNGLSASVLNSNPI